MRERLIASLLKCDKEYDVLSCYKERPKRKQAAEIIADHLLANGVIVPPCKVGDTVYEINKMCLGCIHFTDSGYSDWCECTLDDDKLMFECDFDKECIYEIIPKNFGYEMIGNFGKTVFLTREEAEAALKGR